MNINVLSGIFIFLLGLIIGSFINVVVHRLPRGESLVSPGSHCPHCGEPIRAWDNIPLLSFLVLRGKCRYCGKPIGWRYPIIELLTGIIFGFSYVRFGWQPFLFIALYFSAILLMVSFIDLEHQIIPNKIIFPAIIVGGVAKLVLKPETVWVSLAGFVLAGGFLLLVGLLKKDAMGGGDVKLAAFMGLILGSTVIMALFLAFILGAVAGILLILLKIKGRKELIPFGPFLALGGLITLFWSQELLDVYLGGFQ